MQKASTGHKGELGGSYYSYRLLSLHIQELFASARQQKIKSLLESESFLNGDSAHSRRVIVIDTCKILLILHNSEVNTIERKIHIFKCATEDSVNI